MGEKAGSERMKTKHYIVHLRKSEMVKIQNILKKSIVDTTFNPLMRKGNRYCAEIQLHMEPTITDIGEKTKG